MTDKPEYGVNDLLRLDGVLENTGTETVDIIASAQIVDEYQNVVGLVSSTSIVQLVPLGSGQASLQWNTSKAKPGNYTAILYVRDIRDGALLAEDSTAFVVKEEVQIDATNLVVTPKFTNVKKTETVSASVWLTNWSNVDVSLTAAFEVRDTANTVIATGTTNFSLPVSEFSQKIDIGSFSYNFIQSGQYSVKVEIISNNTVVATGTDAIHIAPAIRIEPTKSLNPNEVLPDGDKRIRVNIKLKSVEE